MRNPFGEVSCEDEIARYSKEYEHRYFVESDFNEAVLRPQSYLVVGRRGSGKTSLTRFLSFQKSIANCRHIPVGTPETYFPELATLGHALVKSAALASIVDTVTSRLVDVWTYLMWQVVFHSLRNKSSSFSMALVTDGPDAESIIRLLVRRLQEQADKNQDIWAIIRAHTKAEKHLNAVQDVYNYTDRAPLIISMDVMEHYNTSNELQMCALAALVQFAATFNVSSSRRNLHLKLLLPAEIESTLAEQYMLNPGKHIKSPVYLHWRPKDLLRLACWRFHSALVEGGYPVETPDWTSFEDVHRRLWVPHFGATLKNGSGLTEGSFPYVFRHTQMRPRQLIWICNEIASCAKDFPTFTAKEIVATVASVETHLAHEVLNSYMRIYPNVSNIVAALHGAPMTFQGKFLDLVAKRSASSWPEKTYSPAQFRKLVAELGIVGRLRGGKRIGNEQFLEADFEYFTQGRLELNDQDDCVIHPMFYKRLNVEIQDKIILPFPDHSDLT